MADKKRKTFKILIIEINFILLSLLLITLNRKFIILYQYVKITGNFILLQIIQIMKEKICFSFSNLSEYRKLIVTLFIRFILFSCSNQISNIFNTKYFAKRNFFPIPIIHLCFAN